MDKDEKVGSLSSMEKFMKMEETLMMKMRITCITWPFEFGECQQQTLGMYIISCYLHFANIFIFMFNVCVCES